MKMNEKSNYFLHKNKYREMFRLTTAKGLLIKIFLTLKLLFHLYNIIYEKKNCLWACVIFFFFFFEIWSLLLNFEFPLLIHVFDNSCFVKF